ncbi:hypothetical protein [Streptomyces violascens]|uniref:hypothetical protein n=1 Tax=Streptomyces violascens TaxID=67381 RepID=UPI0036A78849
MIHPRTALDDAAEAASVRTEAEKAGYTPQAIAENPQLAEKLAEEGRGMFELDPSDPAFGYPTHTADLQGEAGTPQLVYRIYPLPSS